MDQEKQLIKDTIERILDDHCTPGVVDAAEAGTSPETLWQHLFDNGLLQPGDHAGQLLRSCGSRAVPAPVSETIIAGQLLVQAGHEEPLEAMTTLAMAAMSEVGEIWKGEVTNVAFANIAPQILVLHNDMNRSKLGLFNMKDLEITSATNMAGESRASIAIDAKPIKTVNAPARSSGDVMKRGASSRALMMAGAIEAILGLTVEYATTRQQFGRPISKFQAVQQQLAVMAGEAAVSMRASDSVIGLDANITDVAIAKSRIGEAAGKVSDIAHQVHGAIGYTREHRLNHLTRRLWCWRDEYGGERYWQQILGRRICQSSAVGLWSRITAAG